MLPRFRERLERESSPREPPPLLLSPDPVRSRFYDSGSRNAHPDPEAEAAAWGSASRIRRLFPTRLILDTIRRQRSRSPEIQELQLLFGEARDYFGLAPGGCLRIACAGDRHALFAAAGREDRRSDEETYLSKAGPRRYARDLASAFKAFKNVELEWLADGYPNRSPKLEGLPEGWLAWRYGPLARRARSEVASDPDLALLPGPLAFVYYKSGKSWHYVTESDSTTVEVIRIAVAEMPRTSRRVLMLEVPQPGDPLCTLDNPILTRDDLKLAALAKLRPVLVHHRLVLFLNDDQADGPEDPVLACRDENKVPLAKIYRV